MKELNKSFIGEGESKGFLFNQIDKSDFQGLNLLEYGRGQRVAEAEQ
ncbi:MAG: hypothetical protein JXB49_05275 [Bacteroidales bacterium]|nr:hypothetical protein [Bacteroidales bacterium]